LSAPSLVASDGQGGVSGSVTDDIGDIGTLVPASHPQELGECLIGIEVSEFLCVREEGLCEEDHADDTGGSSGLIASLSE